MPKTISLLLLLPSASCLLFVPAPGRLVRLLRYLDQIAARIANEKPRLTGNWARVRNNINSRTAYLTVCDGEVGYLIAHMSIADFVLNVIFS